MFENESESDKSLEKSSSRIFLWGLVGSGALVALISILIYSFSDRQDRPILERVVRAGTPEFDNYKDKIVFEVGLDDKITHPNMIGMFQIEIRAKMHNRGDRTLTGVELLAKMLDLNDKVISSSIGTPIPRIRQQPLKPGESFSVSLKVDAPAKITEDEVKDITIELRGLQFE
jgi:hypothetical protein